MDAIVDRIEEEYAVLELEDRTMLNVDLRSIGGKVKEGSRVCSEDGAFWKICAVVEPHDEEGGSDGRDVGRRRRIEALRSKLFK